MQNDVEAYRAKIEFIQLQLRQMTDPVRPFVRCACHQILAPHIAYKCLYCGQFYCRRCAEEHFGKTVAEYRKDNPLPPGVNLGDLLGEPTE